MKIVLANTKIKESINKEQNRQVFLININEKVFDKILPNNP